MISPLIRWNHEENYHVTLFDSYNTFERRNLVINISDKGYEFIQGHIIDGRVLFPATGWICIVWETFSMMIGMHYENVKVIFEEVRFLRATSLNKNQDVLVTISIHRGTGSFEVIEGNSAVCYGYVKQADEIVRTEIDVTSDENTVTLQADEFYKEMRLHGFCHLGAFSGIKEIRHDGMKGKIKWKENWITFIDSMTHFEELETNSRTLALPTNIRRLVIDPILHRKMLEEKKANMIQSDTEQSEASSDKASDTPDILYDVAVSWNIRVIQAGGVEIHDKRNRIVNRRRPRDAQLEVHQFVPLFSKAKFTLKNAIKIIIHTALEDHPQSRFTTIEIDDAKEVEAENRKEPLCELVSQAFRETPLVASDVTLLSTRENLQLESVHVSSDEITSFNGMDMIVKSKCIGNTEFLDCATKILAENKFILSRESSDCTETFNGNGNLRMITKLETVDGEFLHLLQLKNKKDSASLEILPNVIEITTNVQEWLDPLKDSLKNGPTIVYSHEIGSPSGILGFVNCIRREFSTASLTCFLIADPEAPPFNISHPLYRNQFAINHSINILKNGAWGSYRYLDLVPEREHPNSRGNHFFADCSVKGDLSTLAWFNGPLDVNDDNLDLIRIQYSSLNFKDIMLALARIPDSNFDRVETLSVLGLEFSGIKKDGKRVMGIGLNAGAIATHYDAKRAMLWDVPDRWSLEEAATVPLVYFTVYFAFFVTTKVQRGKTILIHSGSGGVGQAAIETAFAYGLEVFTTVSSAEKRNFLRNKFPKLKPENIGNSRNTTFEKMVLENTKGKGVDFVLNSLSDEKMQASIRCLGMNGTLLEIGKYDMLNGTQLDMRYLTKRINLKAVIFDDLPPDSDEMKVKRLTIMFDQNVIKSKVFVSLRRPCTTCLTTILRRVS